MSCRVRSRLGDDMMKPSPFRTTPPAPASDFRRLGIQGFVAFVTERRLLDYSSLIIGCLVAFASAIVSLFRRRAPSDNHHRQAMRDRPSDKAAPPNAVMSKLSRPDCPV